jgi:hypothetical protein
MAQSKKKMAGDKPKKQTNWDRWAALPEYVREQALLTDMGLLGQDVKEYPFLNKGRDIRLTLQQQDVFRRTIGFPFSLSMLKVYLAQKCNIQNPQDYSIFDIIVALESSLQKTVATQAETGDKPKDTMSKEARALAVLQDHPGWTNVQIANVAGVHPKTLSSQKRMPNFIRARAILKTGKLDIPKGSKDAETGDIEAWEK